jgi:hypothetical protein
MKGRTSMNTIATLRFLLSTALVSAAVPGLAEGPLPAGHDDATYGTGDPPMVVVVGGSGPWGPGIAHDDTAYPTGPVPAVAPEVRVATWPPSIGHDDVQYLGDEPTLRSGLGHHAAVRLSTTLVRAAVPTRAHEASISRESDPATVTAAPEAELKALDDTLTYSVSRARRAEPPDSQARAPERVSQHAQLEPHLMMGACCASGSRHDKEPEP